MCTTHSFNISSIGSARECGRRSGGENSLGIFSCVHSRLRSGEERLISGYVTLCYVTLRYVGSDTRFPSLGDYIQVQKYAAGSKGHGGSR